MDRSVTLPKVFTWGTFDGLHEGHRELLMRLSRLGELYIIVVPSQAKFQKSGYYPVRNEFERRDALIDFSRSNQGILIKEVLVDSLADGLKTFLEKKPEIFCFGYDQDSEYEKGLIALAKEHKMSTTFVRLVNPNGNNIHSSHIRQKLQDASAFSAHAEA